jgi:hypothetical protein
MSEKHEHTDRRDDKHIRCFRCGQLYPREHIRVLEDNCPAVFRGQPLCSLCAEMVQGKKGTGWWAAPATARR